MKFRGMLVVVFLFAGSFALKAQTATFTSTPHKSGESWREESTMELELMLHVDVPGQPMDLNVSNKENYTRAISVMEMFGYDISQFKVNYSAFSKSSKMPQGTTEEKGPVVGRTYKIFRADTVKSIEAEDQKPVSEEESGYLTGEFKKADFGERMNKILNGKTLSFGDSLALSKDLAMNFFGKSSANDVKEFTIKLKSTKDVGGMKCAVFGARIVLNGDNNGMQMEFVLEGDMVVGLANCWPSEIRFTGPVTISGESQGMGITGEGTMSGVKTFVYGSN